MMRIFGGLALLAFGAVSHGTILTFDLTANGNVTLDGDYGDNVTAAVMGDFMYDISNGITPDVTVDYFGNLSANPNMTRWTTGYNDLVNVIEYEPDGASGYNVRLTGSNNQLVALHGFDIGNFGAAISVPEISVEDGNGNVLFSQTNVALNTSSGTHVSFDFGSALVASQILIKVDTTGLGGATDNVGMDNISFTQQPVPEPLTLVGLGALVLVARRKKK